MSGSELETRPDEVFIENGKVVLITNWVNWNGTLWQTLEFKRLGDGTFFCSASDPEHGGGSKRGTLDEVLAWLNYHPNFVGPIRRAFELEVATEDLVRALGGFEGNKFETK